LMQLAHLVSQDEGYSHIAVVPLVSAWFLWRCRDQLERSADHGSRIGAGIAFGLGVFGYATGWVLYCNNILGYLSVWMLSLVCVWVGCFLLAFGLGAARKAAFPLAFLLFMVPLPGVLLQYVIRYLQDGSAALTYLIFRLLGVPVDRQRFMFALPNLTIEIAQECSGIRSSISLLLTTLIVAQLSLSSKVNKLLLVLSVVPIAVFKNAVRIVTLSLLSIYVNPSFLTGNLHHRGGIVFFLLALGLIFGLTELLRRLEARYVNPHRQTQVSTSGH
jgi:exosortase